MKTWTLVKRTATTGKNERYIYKSEDGRKVTFETTDEAFEFKVIDSDRVVAEFVIQGFIVSGVRQHTFAGGFNEAILTVQAPL